MAVVGYGGVGKSAFISKFVNTDNVDEDMHNLPRKSFSYGDQNFSISVLDTKGQDVVSYLTPDSMVGIGGYVLMYSVSSRYSFQIIKFINDKLLMNAMTLGVPRVLVASKADLVMDRCGVQFLTHCEHSKRF